MVFLGGKFNGSKAKNNGFREPLTFPQFQTSQNEDIAHLQKVKLESDQSPMDLNIPTEFSTVPDVQIQTTN